MTMIKNRPQSTQAGKSRRSVPGRRSIASLLLVLVCWTTLLVLLPSSTGNPVLRTTSPGHTETVKSPDQVQLTFDRPVPAGLATVRIINPPGEQVVFDRPINPPGRPDTISVPMPKARFGGTYVVAWTLPSDQLEPIRGAFTFEVFQPTTPGGVPEIETQHDPVVAVFHTTARIAAVASMAVLIGAVFFVAALWPAGVRSKPVRRVVKFAWVGLVAATLAVIASFGPYAAWVPLSDAFDTGLLWATLASGTGAGLLSRLLLLVPITVGIVKLMESPPVEQQGDRLLRGGAVLGCSAALAATWSFARPHPPGSLTPLALGVDLVLLIAIAVSVTDLGMLWLLLRDKDRSAPYIVVPRWYRTAAVCAGLLVVVGGYHAWRYAGGFEPVVTSHGWLLTGVLALVALLIGAAALSRTWVRGQLAQQAFAEAVSDGSRGGKRLGPGVGRFRKLIAGGTGIAGLIVGTTAVLVTAQPPHTAHAQKSVSAPLAIREQAPPFRLEFDTGKPGGQGSVDLILLPAAAGPDQVRLDTRISIRGETGAAKDDMTVTAALSQPGKPGHPIPVQLSHAGPGYSLGSATVPTRGQWELALTLRAGDGSRQTVTQPLDVR